MKTIDHFRHALRSKPSAHLNAKGVRISRNVGERMLRYDRVVTSPRQRAIETAVAMGFAVDRTEPLLEAPPKSVDARVSHDAGFAAFAAARDADPRISAWLAELRAFQAALAAELPPDGSALIVSHGGVVEWCALACLPKKAAKWGEPIDKSEGIRLRFDRGDFVDGETLRLLPSDLPS